MARAKPIGWIVAGLALLLGGAALAASSTTSKPARKPDEPGEAPTQPTEPPPPPPPQTPQTPEEQPPPTQTPPASVQESAKAEAHKRGFAAAAEQFAEWGKQKRVEDAADAEAQREREIAAGAIATAGAAIGSLAGSVAGPVIGLIATGIALMVRYVKSWGGIIVGGNRIEFTGWRANSYHFRDIPIYGPEANRFWEICQSVVLRQEQLEALKRLVAAYPNGPGPDEVKVSFVGDYDYLFNPTSPGDLSQGERDALRVFGQQVYSPADVTLRGPRGFDPKNPRAWKVPGEAASIYDRVVKLEPGVRAAGL